MSRFYFRFFLVPLLLLLLARFAQPQTMPRIDGPLVASRNPNYFRDAKGNVLILSASQTWNTLQDWGCVPFRVIEQAIAEVGVDTTVLSTDLGQPQTPPPAEGLRLYADRLKSSGFSFEHIRQMMCTNPAHLLSADGVGKV
jgi:hypothetical protein